MKLGILGALAAATALAGSMAHAAPVSYDIDLFISSSPDLPSLVSAVTPAGTATLTYDTATPGWGFGVGQAVGADGVFTGNYDFSILLFGQTFTDTDDPDAGISIDFATFPSPTGTGEPLTFNFVINEPDVAITDPTIISFAAVDGIISNTSAGPNSYSMNVEVAGIAPPPAVIPLPAPFLMLGAGLAGLGLRNKLRKKA